jgi:GNAT superfamily N-acetyltransferase
MKQKYLKQQEIFPNAELKENIAYFVEYFGRGITTYIYMINNDFKGFVSFHIDSKVVPGYVGGYNGWGHLAEIYVKKEMRGLGLGKKMVKKAEEELVKLNIKKVYLTDLSGNDCFWQSLGYTDTCKIEPKEGGRIYEKNI